MQDTCVPWFIEYIFVVIDGGVLGRFTHNVTEIYVRAGLMESKLEL